MKKKLAEGAVINQLKSGSVFFGAEHTQTPERVNTRPDEQVNTRSLEQTNERTPEHPPNRADEQLNTRTPARVIKRSSYNLYVDQVVAIKRLAFEQDSDQSDLMRNIIDAYLKANE